MVPLLVSLFGACAPAGRATPEAPTVLEGSVASADGVPIHYRSSGEGGPPLVLIHGWACDATYWDAQVAAFAPRQQVVTLDLAGHGRSGAGRTEWTVPAFAADIQAVLDGLDLRGVILVGHSTAGPVIVEAARRVPDRVAGLVAVAALQDVEFRFEPAELEEFLAPFQQDFRTSTLAFARGLVGDGGDPGLAAAIAADMASAPAGLSIEALRALFSFDLPAALRDVGAPILALNPAAFPTELEHNRRYAPQFELQTLTGVGQFPMREAPASFNRSLEQAVARVTGGHGA